MSRIWNRVEQHPLIEQLKSSATSALGSVFSADVHSGRARHGRPRRPSPALRQSLHMEPLENRVLLAADYFLQTDAPPGSPLAMDPGGVSAGTMRVNAVNGPGGEVVPEDLLAGWQTKLEIRPDTGAVGTLEFNSFAEASFPPTPYIFEGRSDNAFCFFGSCVNTGDTLLLLDFVIPPGVEVPASPGAGLADFDFVASADAQGLFGIYAVPSTDIVATEWTDSTGVLNLFENVQDAGGTRIGEVLVGGAAEEADLSIQKTDSLDPVVAGTQLTYTITVDNNGPSDAQNVVVTDTLPAGTTYVSNTDNCVEGPVRTLTCSLGTITASTSTSFDVVVDVAPDVADGTILTNEASVASDTPEANPGDESTTLETQVNTEADLVIIKSADQDPVVAGTQLTYAITVFNNGPSDAQNVVVTDTLPSGTTYVSNTDSCVEGPVGTLTCSLGTIAASSSATFDIVVDVPSGVSSGTTLTNEASVVSDTTEADPGDETATEDTSVMAAADLVIIKSDDQDPVVAGTQLTYTITVHNNGPSDAQNVVVTDTLPVGTSYVSNTDNCVEGPVRTLTCSLGTIAASSSTSFDIVVDVAPEVADGATLTNEASVVSDATEADPGDETATEDTSVIAEADLVIIKSDDQDPVVAGTQLTYTITVDNNGPSDAQNVVVTDTLPAGTTYLSNTDSCVEGPMGTLTCSLGTIAASSSTSFDIVVDVASDVADGATLTNEASVVSDTTEADPGDETTTEETAVIAEADLRIDKSGVPSPVVAGDPLTYTVTVTNGGPSDAQNVVVTDTLPAGVTLDSTSGCAEDPNGVPTCSLGTISAGASTSYTIVVTVGAETSGVITNQVSVGSDTTDPNPDNNTASEDTLVNPPSAPKADLSIEKIDSDDPVTAGEQLTYTVTVSNSGPDDAQNVVVTDTLPAGVTLVSTTGCAEDPAGVPTCSLGTITAGSSAQYSITVNVDPSVANDAELTNVVNVTSDTTDPDFGNNTASQTTTVTTEADLSIEKSDDPDPVVAGNSLTYMVTVTNDGPSDAQNVVVTDTLPAGVTFVSTNGCGEDPNGVPTCSLGTIAAGASKSYSILVTVDAETTGVIENVVTVTSDTADPNGENNTASEQTQVNPPSTPQADLAITKIDSTDPVAAGDPLTYTVTVTNNGPNDAQNVVVTDTLPAGVTFVSTTGCGEDPNGVPTCSLGTIAAGTSTSYTISVTVNSDTSGVIENVATVTSDTSDPDTSNNTATEQTTVQGIVEPPPQVVDVLISGASWAIDPFSLITGPNLDDPLPWVNMTRIDVVFDQDVDVEIVSLTLAGVNVPQYNPDGFNYDAGSQTATWTFATPFGNDKLLLNLAGEASDAAPIDSEPGLGGTLLGGGSDFELRFDVLPGDGTRDGSTTVTDLVNVGTRVGASIGPPASGNYLAQLDIDGDGMITVADATNVATRIVSLLPAGEPVLPSPSFAALRPTYLPADDIDALFADDEAFDEMMHL